VQIQAATADNVVLPANSLGNRVECLADDGGAVRRTYLGGSRRPDLLNLAPVDVRTIKSTQKHTGGTPVSLSTNLKASYFWYDIHLLKHSYILTLFAITLIGHAMQAADAPTKTEPLPTFADVAYGPAERQTLDFYQAPGNSPRPLLVIINGGGWIHSEKTLGGYARFIPHGISVACIRYRLTPDDPLPAPVLDAARAVQYLRSKAVEWNIDPQRVIACGDSAGGCSALWLATHDDLATPAAVDPVERQSTRLTGAAVLNAQTTIEPASIRAWIGERGVQHGMIRSAGGFKTNEEMDQAIANRPKVADLYHEFSPVNHLSADDPPIFFDYGTPLENTTEGIHHSLFGLKFLEKAESLGIKTCYLGIRKDDRYPGYPGGMDTFINRLLQP
jgi:arylformamidase